MLTSCVQILITLQNCWHAFTQFLITAYQFKSFTIYPRTHAYEGVRARAHTHSRAASRHQNKSTEREQPLIEEHEEKEKMEEREIVHITYSYTATYRDALIDERYIATFFVLFCKNTTVTKRSHWNVSITYTLLILLQLVQIP